MNIHYQLILLGSFNKFRQEIENIFLQHVAELGIDARQIKIIDKANSTDYYSNAPAFCIYFGDPAGNYEDLVFVQQLKSEGKLILPVVDHLAQFNKQIPVELRTINGAELNLSLGVEAIVSVALEGLGLLRISRRLFISYKRDESTTVAIQLFEQLEKNGFDVFLDTHSIPKAEPFQEELWHRLADTDVVILLNTPNFLQSEWTKEELARANSMSIGILQLIWPKHNQERYAQLSMSIQLKSKDFGNDDYSTPKSYLITNTINEIVSQAESLRARTLAARQTNMIKEFLAAAGRVNVSVNLQAGKYIIVTKKNGHTLMVIPTVGVPQAFTYYQSEELFKTIKANATDAVYLLYDHLNIRDRWVKHLDWLDNYLDVRTLKVLEIDVKLPTII